MAEIFHGQHTEERILVITRAHWITMLGRTLLALFLFLLIPVSYRSLGILLPSLVQEPYRNPVLLVLTLFGYGVWVFFFLGIMSYWLDVWIVTDERVLKVEQRGLFRREFDEFRLSRVQDVSVEIHGLIPTLFRFGNLVVQTAGENPRFRFQAIPHPERVKNLILFHQDSAFKKMPTEKGGLPMPPSPL